MNIAIDGPAGAGKSTIAKRAAKELGFIYVDTGAMYRAIAVYLIDNGVSAGDEAKVAEAIDDISIEIRYEDGAQQVYLNGDNVTGRLRTEEVGNMASKSSALPCVREKLLSIQRELAAKNDVVMDGRDIGTVVLPKADVKIFLTASAEVRAKRRFDELQQKGDKTPYAQILAETKQRDKQDSERAIAPLKQAADAVLLDTSGDTVEQSVNAILDIVRRKLG